MADLKKPTIDSPEYKIRMTLTSTNVKALEKVTSEFIARAKKRELKHFGPIRMPTKTLRITTRKTPCGEGSKTWSRYQLRIHKRVLDFKSTSEVVKDVTKMTIDPVVTVEIIFEDSIKQAVTAAAQQQQPLQPEPAKVAA